MVIAEEQTAGRGRAGHTWHSEKTNGIYMTVLLRPPISPQQAPLITLVAGLAVREAIMEQTGSRRICAGRTICSSAAKNFAAF